MPILAPLEASNSLSSSSSSARGGGCSSRHTKVSNVAQGCCVAAGKYGLPAQRIISDSCGDPWDLASRLTPQLELADNHKFAATCLSEFVVRRFDALQCRHQRLNLFCCLEAPGVGGQHMEVGIELLQALWNGSWN